MLRICGWGVLIGTVVALILMLSPGAASSRNQPQWSGLARAANRMCYVHGGVKQIVYTQPSYAAAFSEADVVCMNNWAYNLANWSNG